MVRSILYLAVVSMMEVAKEAAHLGNGEDNGEKLRGKPKLLMKK